MQIASRDFESDFLHRCESRQHWTNRRKITFETLKVIFLIHCDRSARIGRRGTALRHVSNLNRAKRRRRRRARSGKISTRVPKEPSSKTAISITYSHLKVIITCAITRAARMTVSLARSSRQSRRPAFRGGTKVSAALQAGSGLAEGAQPGAVFASRGAAMPGRRGVAV